MPKQQLPHYVHGPRKSRHGTHFYTFQRNDLTPSKTMRSPIVELDHDGKPFMANLDAPEFWSEYAGLMANKADAPARKLVANVIPHSMQHICQEFLGSEYFKRELVKISQDHHRREIKRLCDWCGDCDANQVELENLETYLEPLPRGTYNQAVKTLRVVFTFAKRKKLVRFNPTHELKYDKRHINHHTWTLQEIAQFRARHPIGSKARLAMELLFWTGQRRSDIIRMGKHMLTPDGFLEFVQWKNHIRNPIQHWSPVSAYLRYVIMETKGAMDGPTFLVSTPTNEKVRYVMARWTNLMNSLRAQHPDWTIKAIYREMQTKGYPGSYDAVNDAYRGRKQGKLLEPLPPKPYTAGGFEAQFRVWCYEAGIASGVPARFKGQREPAAIQDRCTPHGLRYALACLLADLGLSAHIIQAVTGHRTLKEIERYTQRANKKRLARPIHRRAGIRWRM